MMFMYKAAATGFAALLGACAVHADITVASWGGAAILTDNQPFEIVWDGQVLEQEYIVMVKGTKNYDQALDFMIFASAPEQQAAQAKWINYGPMRKSSLDIIAANEPFFHDGRNIMPHMPNRRGVMARSVIADPYWWADNGAEVAERFAAWMEN